MNKLNRNTIVRIAVIALLCIPLRACLTSASLHGFNPLDNNPYDELTFDRQLWREDEHVVDASNRRGRMAQDIVRNYLKQGMADSDVVGLLGEPRQRVLHPAILERQGYTDHQPGGPLRFLEPDKRATTILAYYLGEEMSPFWGIDRAWLYVYLNQQGRYIGSRMHAE